MNIYGAKVDLSQTRLVPFLRAHGASFRSTPAMRAGEPDGIVGYLGVDCQVEFKTGKEDLRPEQLEYHVRWKGANVAVLRTEDDVTALLAVMRKMGAKRFK